MSPVGTYVLIFLAAALLLSGMLSTIREGLENKGDTCTYSASKGCKTIAMQKNKQAAQYTDKLLVDSKSTIQKLMEKVSKLVASGKVKTNENSKNIALNLKHAQEMTDATKPDK